MLDLGAETEHLNFLFLTNPVSTILCLQINLRVPKYSDRKHKTKVA